MSGDSVALAYQAEPGGTGVAPQSDSNEVVEVGMLEMFEEEKLMSIIFDVKGDGVEVLQKNSVHYFGVQEHFTMS